MSRPPLTVSAVGGLFTSSARGRAGQQVVADPHRIQANRLGVLAKGAYLRPAGQLAGPVGQRHGNDNADSHASKSRLEILLATEGYVAAVGWFELLRSSARYS